MSSDRSIDGLTRRKSSNTIGIDGLKPKKTSSAPAKKAATVKPVQKTPTVQKSTSLGDMDERDQAISDFLSSVDVRDDNPESLVGELPKKKESKRERKKRLKAAAQPKKKKSKKKKVILSVVGVFLLLLIGLGVWVFMYGNSLVAKITGGGDLWSIITADPDIPLNSDPNTGRTNILIFGTEGYSMDDSKYAGAQLTDSIMMASLDQETGDIRTISLPRDLKAKTCTSTSKMNEVYYCTYSKNDRTEESRAEYEKLAARALADQVEEVLGLEIQYFVHVNWQAVVQVVDILGGVDVAFIYQGETWSGEEVAIETTDKRGLADYWNSATRSYGIQFANGEVYHLNGEQALGVARSRNEAGGYGASGGNFSREQFQQKILQALILKAKQTNFAADFVAALGILESVGDNLRTDFKDTEMKTLFKLAGKIDLGSMQSVSIQKTDEDVALLTSGMLQSTNGQFYSYVYPVAGAGNYADIHTYVARRLSTDALASEWAKVAVMNANGISGLATSEASLLRTSGYNVVTAEDAPSDLTGTEGIVIYQLNRSMSGTAKKLGELYETTVFTDGIPASLSGSGYDFVVVLGAGYEGF